MVRRLPEMQETRVQSLGREDLQWQPLQYSCLENSMDRGVWWATVQGVSGASPVAQTVKNLPAMQETLVQSLGREDTLEKDMATHTSILAWKIPWTEGPGRLQFIGSQRVGPTEPACTVAD